MREIKYVLKRALLYNKIGRNKLGNKGVSIINVWGFAAAKVSFFSLTQT